MSDEENSLSKLEKKFLDVMDKVHQEIKVHLENARKELKLAEKISEKQGIPFSSDINIFCERVYFPKSFDKKWKDDNESDLHELLSEEGLTTNDNNGWEYWSSSSLTC